MEAAPARLHLRRSPAGAVAALTLLAVAVRFGTLGAKSFWGDEVLGNRRPALIWQPSPTAPFIRLSSTRDNLG